MSQEKVGDAILGIFSVVVMASRCTLLCVENEGCEKNRMDGS